MAAAKQKEETIEIPQIELERLEIKVIGDTPLITHRWSEKSKKQMLDKMTKAAKTGREPKDPEREYEDSMYRMPDGGYGFPALGFKMSAVGACRFLGTDIPMTVARGAFRVLGENGGELVRIESDEPIPREDPVTVGKGSDLRYRAEFQNWSAKLFVVFCKNVFSREQVVNLLNHGGFTQGVGEWRPEKNGQFGTYHVATETV